MNSQEKGTDKLATVHYQGPGCSYPARAGLDWKSIGAFQKAPVSHDKEDCNDNKGEASDTIRVHYVVNMVEEVDLRGEQISGMKSASITIGDSYEDD